MYQVLGLKKLLTSVAFLGLIIFFIWTRINPPKDGIGFIRIVLASANTSVLIFVVIGQMTPFIAWFARQPLINRVLPDLDGDWYAELTSNWATIAKAHGIEVKNTQPVTAKIRITVRLFTVRMELVSDSGYSESDTVAVRVLKNQEHGDVSLHYIYKNETPIAENTDSSVHYGAASLKLKKKFNGDYSLEGHYWTNRNWEKGLNTAGRICMYRTKNVAA